MTLNTILHRPFQHETIPAGSTGEWYVATDALHGKTVEELGIPDQTGALVLASRKGFWNGNLDKEDVELLLWGTQEQLAAAQEAFKLQPAVDALLDRPELYWG